MSHTDILTLGEPPTDGAASDSALPDTTALFASNVPLTIDEPYLLALTQLPSLHTLTKLHLNDLHTQNTSFQHIGRLCYNLQHLELHDCTVQHLRDLSCHTLNKLTHLTLANCQLTDLDTLDSIPQLQQLDLSHNQLEDVSGLMMCETLQMLDVSHNPIQYEAELTQLQFLEALPALHTLALHHTPYSRLQHYKRVVCSQLKQLRVLDGDEVLAVDRTSVSAAEAQMLRPASRSRSRQSDDNLLSQQSNTSHTANRLQSPDSTFGSNDNVRPGTATVRRPATAAGMRPATAVRPPISQSTERPPSASSSNGQSQAVSASTSGSSGLTYGGEILQGRFVLAMRHRRRAQLPPLQANGSAQIQQEYVRPSTPSLSSIAGHQRPASAASRPASNSTSHRPAQPPIQQPAMQPNSMYTYALSRSSSTSSAINNRYSRPSSSSCADDGSTYNATTYSADSSNHSSRVSSATPAVNSLRNSINNGPVRASVLTSSTTGYSMQPSAPVRGSVSNGMYVSASRPTSGKLRMTDSMAYMDADSPTSTSSTSIDDVYTIKQMQSPTAHRFTPQPPPMPKQSPNGIQPRPPAKQPALARPGSGRRPATNPYVQQTVG